jgi:hypothetical protein
VELLATVDVNVPGVIARLVAPVVTQLSVLLEPELMLARFAVKEAIEGPEPAGDAFGVVDEQLARLKQPSRTKNTRP